MSRRSLGNLDEDPDSRDWLRRLNVDERARAEYDLPPLDELEREFDLPVRPPDDEGLTAAATDDGHTGAMVALVPTDADLDRLAVPDGEPRDELHLTLWYLGDAVDLPPDGVDGLRIAARDAASAAPGPAEAPAFGVGLWNWEGEEPSVVLNVGDPDSALRDVREAVGRAGADLLGDWPPVDNHRPWAPHVCLAYTDDLAAIPEALARLGTITFDRLRLAVGPDVYDYPLGG